MKKLGLKKKMMMLFFGIIIVFVVFPSVFFYTRLNTVFRENMINSAEVAASENAEKVRVFIKTVMTAVKQVNNNEEAYMATTSEYMTPIARMIVHYGSKYDRTTLAQLKDEMSASRKLMENAFSTASGNISGKLTYTLIISSDYPAKKHFPLYDERSQNGIFRVIHDEELIWLEKARELEGRSYWYSEDCNENTVYMAKLLQYRSQEENTVQTKELGVIKVSFDMSWITENEFVELSSEPRLFLVDQDGTVLYKNKCAALADDTTNVVQLLFNSEEGKAKLQSINDKQFLIQKNNIADGLTLLTVTPFYDIQMLINEAEATLLSVIVLILLSGMVLVALMNRMYLKPVLKLAKHMESGILEKIEHTEDCDDEICVLYQGYDRLQHRVLDLLEETWKSAEKEKSAKLHALQLQINPHFLHNTLGMISCTALLRGEDEIADQVSTLSSILRYTVRNPEALVPLKDEAEIIRLYEKIWKQSYEDSIDFSLEIDERCESVLIPKMIIQPLVENAVMHGVRGSNDRAKVSLKIFSVPQVGILIMVIDSGTGVDTERINAYLRGDLQLEAKRDSLGIKNVNERIQMYFGENGQLRYYRNEIGNTVAEITISKDVLDGNNDEIRSFI